VSDTSTLASNGSRMLKKKKHAIYILFKRARIYILFLKKSVHDNFYWPSLFKLAVASAREPRDLA